MKSVKLALIAAALVGAAAPVWATSINLGGSETNLQQILNGITCNTSLPGCVPGGTSSVNVLTDQVTPDEVWGLGGTGGAFSQMIIELAGYAPYNTFGIYDLNDPSKRVQLFSGAASAGSQSLLAITADGSVWAGNLFGGTFHDSGINLSSNLFGFYLDTPGGLWFSQNARNSDGADHMVAFEGTGTDRVRLPNSQEGYWLENEYILAWEDLPSSTWDYDYNDFVVMVESVKTVPEPGALALLGLGLAGLGLARRRRRVQ